MRQESLELDDQTADRLLRHQDELQEEARQIARELSLITILAQAGTVTEHGSSVSGLMVWPDLDFGVTSPGLDQERAFEIMLPLLTHPQTTMVRYTNETGARSFSGLPRDERLFFMVYYAHMSGVIWKIDIPFWLHPEPRGEHEYSADIKERLTRDTRLAILWIKDLWHSSPVYPVAVGSVDIHDAVLNHGVRTPDMFDQYLVERGKPTLSEAGQVRLKARDV